MIKFCFKLIGCFWILSPAIFYFTRTLTPFNHPKDTWIMLFFCGLSFITMFFTYKTWEDK